MKKSSSLRRNAQIWSVKILTALKPTKGAGVETQLYQTKHSCPVRQQKQKTPSNGTRGWNAARFTYKRHHPFEKLSGTFNIKQRRTIGKQNVASVCHMLVSQPPQDSNAPVRLAQFKHDADHKHC